MGPRILVRVGTSEGFVADEIPLHGVGCPVAWREWLRDDSLTLSANAWTAQWMGDLKQFTPLVHAGRGVARAFAGGRNGRTPVPNQGPHLAEPERVASGTKPLSPPTSSSSDPYVTGRNAFLVPTSVFAPALLPAPADSSAPGLLLVSDPTDSAAAVADSSGTALDLPTVKGEAVGSVTTPGGFEP